MNNYVCKVADRNELIERWKYLVEIHSVNNIWEKFRDNALNNFDNGNTISYVGILDGEIICEATAYINEDAFIDDIDDYDDLLSDERCYLAAFRTNKEYQNQGYFSELYKFMIDDLKSKGYRKVTLGVEPEEEQNKIIYKKYGFTNLIKISTEVYPDGTEIEVEYYEKEI